MQVPVRMEFIKKLDDKSICKEWLRIEPTSAFIAPGKLFCKLTPAWYFFCGSNDTFWL